MATSHVVICSQNGAAARLCVPPPVRPSLRACSREPPRSGTPASAATAPPRVATAVPRPAPFGPALPLRRAAPLLPSALTLLVLAVLVLAVLVLAGAGALTAVT